VFESPLGARNSSHRSSSEEPYARGNNQGFDKSAADAPSIHTALEALDSPSRSLGARGPGKDGDMALIMTDHAAGTLGKILHSALIKPHIQPGTAAKIALSLNYISCYDL